MARDFFDSLESQLVKATRQGEVKRVKRVRMRVARWVSTPLTAAAIAVAASATAIAAGITGPLAADLAADHTPVATTTVSRPTARPVAPGASRPRAVATTAAATTGARPITVAAAGTVSTPGEIPAGGPVPSGFQPQTFTAISEFTWWLMGPAPCASPPCTSIVRTVNGGRSFVGLHAPRTDLVSQLRFANEQDGYAFGPQLWSTHDGGQTWGRVDVQGTVTQLAAANGYVFALVHRDGYGALLRSPVGSDQWTALHGLVGYPFSGLWVQGSTVLVESQNLSGSSSHLMISLDSGGSFTRAADPPPSIACSFDATVDAQVIWAPCATGMMSGVWRSTDGGRSFDAVMLPGGGPAQLQLPNSAAFGAASPGTAVVGYQRLYRTTDGGVHWNPVPNMPVAQETAYIGFTDATHGVVIQRFGSNYRRDWRLYYTTDAGANYHYVAIAP